MQLVKQKWGTLWTYTYLNSTKAQVDYILMNKKWINSTLNCGAYSSFEGVSSDHRIVTTKICQGLCRNTKQTAQTTFYDWPSLNDWYINNKYTITVKNKCINFHEISETLIVNDEYENFNAHLEAVVECIPTKLRAKHRVLWESLEVRKNEIMWKQHSYEIYYY